MNGKLISQKHDLPYQAMTAKEMALQSHNLSQDSKYARMKNDNSLWIWSDNDNCWKMIASDDFISAISAADVKKL